MYPCSHPFAYLLHGVNLVADCYNTGQLILYMFLCRYKAYPLLVIESFGTLVFIFHWWLVLKRGDRTFGCHPD